MLLVAHERAQGPESPSKASASSSSRTLPAASARSECRCSASGKKSAASSRSATTGTSRGWLQWLVSEGGEQACHCHRHQATDQSMCHGCSPPRARPDSEQLDKIFIVQEFCSGGQLSAATVAKKSDNDTALAWRYLKDVLCGLDHIHTRHVVHLDIKPENLILGAEGTVKIVDFGTSYRLVGRSGGRGAHSSMSTYDDDDSDATDARAPAGLRLMTTGRPGSLGRSPFGHQNTARGKRCVRACAPARVP